MATYLIKLRKLCNLAVIDIYGKKKAIPASKKLGKRLLKASPNNKLRVYAYIRVSSDRKIEGDKIISVINDL